MVLALPPCLEWNPAWVAQLVCFNGFSWLSSANLKFTAGWTEGWFTPPDPVGHFTQRVFKVVCMGPCLPDTEVPVIKEGWAFFSGFSIVRRNAENDHCCKIKNRLDYFGHLKWKKHCVSSTSTFWFSTSVRWWYPGPWSCVRSSPVVSALQLLLKP